MLYDGKYHIQYIRIFKFITDYYTLHDPPKLFSKYHTNCLRLFVEYAENFTKSLYVKLIFFSLQRSIVDNLVDLKTSCFHDRQG